MQTGDVQREICRVHRAGFLAADPSETLGIALSTLDGRQPLNALRHPPDAGTCGWFVWAGEEFPTADDAFAPMHIAHVPDYCPDLLQYLGLAPGWRVLLAPGYEDVWFDKTLLDV
jgi:hypothetical protein